MVFGIRPAFAVWRLPKAAFAEPQESPEETTRRRSQRTSDTPAGEPTGTRSRGRKQRCRRRPVYGGAAWESVDCGGECGGDKASTAENSRPLLESELALCCFRLESLSVGESLYPFCCWEQIRSRERRKVISLKRWWAWFHPPAESAACFFFFLKLLKHVRSSAQLFEPVLHTQVMKDLKSQKRGKLTSPSTAAILTTEQ